MIAGLVAVALALAAVLFVVVRSDPTDELPVEGYVVAGAGTGVAALDRSSTPAGLSFVGIDGVTVRPGGSRLSDLPEEVPALVRAAHARGAKAELLVSNYDDEIGDFSPAVATALLSSAEHRDAVIAKLVRRARAADVDGVQIDLEAISAGDANGLSAFASELRSALPKRYQLSIALSASVDRAAYRRSGYDLPALAATVDRIVLMTYDQHGPTWSGAGPVGGRPWTAQSIRAAIAGGIPREKLDAGVAQYGYTWPGDGSDGIEVTVAKARRLAGSRARYDDQQGEWTATLSNGTVMWWSDGRSLRVRTRYARERGLHGVAIWELGSAAPDETD